MPIVDRGPMVDLPLICVVGPTASGKTDLALQLAASVGGEIVAADSRQIYRGMDIGTAKPSQQQRKLVPHHMIDVAGVLDRYSVVRYFREAMAAIESIEARGRVPFLVGGTGQYVEAFTRGIDPAPSDAEMRARLEEDLRRDGLESMARRLRELDPAAAGTTDLRNPRRVVRALEIQLAEGRSIRELERPGQSARQTLVIGLDVPRPELLHRIARRTEWMYGAGLLDEARRFWGSGHARDSVASATIGYRDAFAYLAGLRSLREAKDATTKATGQYARRQMTWFRNRESVEWYHPGAAMTQDILLRIDGFLEQHPSQR